MKRPSTLLYHIVLYKEITLKKFNAKSDHSIQQDAHCKLHISSKFSRWGAWPLAGVQLISLVIYENSHFSFRTGACPGIRKGGGGAQNLKAFFFLLFNFSGGGAQLRK